LAEIELLLANRDFVRALARELLSEPADVDDVVQQTMLAAWISGSGKGKFRSWLATVARNFARQVHRRDERRRDREQRAAAGERVLSVTEVLEREERRRSVVQAVLGLAEPNRTAVLLRFYEGLGAVAQGGWQLYRLTGAALDRLAVSSKTTASPVE